MRTRRESYWWAMIVGAGLIALGVLGFFYESGFDKNASGSLFGVFEVNGTWNVFHIVLGAIGVTAAMTGLGRWYSLITGWVLIIVGLGQLFVGSEDLFLSAVPAGTGLAVFQIVLGITGIIAGWRSQRELREAGEYQPTERGY